MTMATRKSPYKSEPGTALEYYAPNDITSALPSPQLDPTRLMDVVRNKSNPSVQTLVHATGPVESPEEDKIDWDIHEETTIWGHYIERGRHYDADFVRDTESTVDSLLIFAGLFSAVVSAFISQTFPLLKADTADTLDSILQQLRQPGSQTKAFAVPEYAIRVNCFLFAGLFVSMLVALLSILVKQWTRSYQRDLAGISSSHLRARIRHFRHNGVKRWRLSGIVGFLSVLMHLSMFISAIGITDLLLAVSPIVGWVTFSLLVAGVVFFFATTVLPIFSLDAPFRSPLSDFIIHFIGFMKKHIHLPQTLRRRPKAGDAETGLEDQVGRHEVGACEASEIVRTRIDLDFHILCHLLENADRSTERWLLDQCFEKLPTLALLEQKHPELILKRDTLVYIYIFLAKGCVISQEQTKRLNPNRRQRAVRLCEFMAWFLSLPRSETIQGRLVQRLFHQDGFDALELPKVLAEDSSSVESLIPPLTALARLKHLKSHTVDAIACTACEEASRELKDLTTGTRSAARNQVVQVVTSFVIMHSVCPIFHHAFAVDEKAGLEKASAPSICTASLEILRRSLANLSFTDKKEVEEWIKLVKRWSNGVDPLIRTQWFDKLLEIFNGVPIMVIPTLAVDDGTTPSPLQPTGSSPPSEPLVDSDSDTDPHRQARDQEAPGAKATSSL